MPKAEDDLPPLQTSDEMDRTKALLGQEVAILADYWEKLRDTKMPEDLCKDIVRDFHMSRLAHEVFTFPYAEEDE